MSDNVDTLTAEEQDETLAVRSAELPEATRTGADFQCEQGLHVNEEAAEEGVPPSVFAGARLQRIQSPKPPGSKYRCVGNAVIRKGCAMDSDKATIDKLEAGQEITVLEQVTLSDGTVRLRFEGGKHSSWS